MTITKQITVEFEVSDSTALNEAITIGINSAFTDDIQATVISIQDGEKFPNGFSSWMETHHEIVTALMESVTNKGSLSYNAMTGGGTGRLYELGESLTDEFEAATKGWVWNSEFYDTLHSFLQAKTDGKDFIFTDL